MEHVPDWVPAADRELAQILLQAQVNYRFKPFAGPTFFIQSTVRTSELALYNHDGLNGWAGLFTGPFKKVAIETDHYGMIREPRVAELAGWLRTMLLPDLNRIEEREEATRKVR